MLPSSDQVETYLASGETVVARTPGTFFDGSYRSEGAVAVTDRRILFVADGEGFVDVSHDAISSIQGRPRRGFTVRGLAPVLVAVAGASIAAASVLAVTLLAPHPLAVLLLFATVGGVAVAEDVRRRDHDAVRRLLDDATAPLVSALSTIRERWRQPAGLRHPTNGEGFEGDPDLLVLGIVTTALIALVGLVAVTGSLLVVPLALSAVGGVALAEYGYRRHRDREAAGGDRSLGRDVSIHLLDGRVVHLQVGPGVRFERDLSAVVRESTSRLPPGELPSQ